MENNNNNNNNNNINFNLNKYLEGKTILVKIPISNIYSLEKSLIKFLDDNNILYYLERCDFIEGYSDDFYKLRIYKLEKEYISEFLNKFNMLQQNTYIELEIFPYNFCIDSHLPKYYKR